MSKKEEEEMARRRTRRKPARYRRSPSRIVRRKYGGTVKRRSTGRRRGKDKKETRSPRKMNFEKLFPSLKKLHFTAYTDKGRGALLRNVVNVSDVEDFCVDKQRLKPIIKFARDEIRSVLDSLTVGGFKGFNFDKAREQSEMDAEREAIDEAEKIYRLILELRL